MALTLYENNDVLERAMLLQPDQRYDGIVVESYNDIDWFKIEVNNPTGMVTKLESTSSHVHYALYDSELNEIDSCNIQWYNNIRTVVVDPGRYYVKICSPIGTLDFLNNNTSIEINFVLPDEGPLTGLAAKDYCLHYDPETRKYSLVLEPIDAATGAHIIEKNLLSVNGARTIEFNLSYNSLLLDEGSMGKGWGHNHEARLEFQLDGTIKLKWTSNRENGFIPADDTNYTSTDQACRLDTLAQNPDGTYTLTRKDQSQYIFNASGHLIEQRNSTGQPIVMAYNELDQLVIVTEPVSGQTVTLDYDDEGLIEKLSYNPNRYITFQYDSNHNLVGITDPAGKTTVFTYDEIGQVLSETDGEGEGVFINTYDEQGRVIAQDDGLSDNLVSTITYDETSQLGTIRTTITDREGNSKIYVHDRDYQLIEVIDELEYSTKYTYDEYGNRTSEIDALNQSTCTTYDERNNPITITDALGNVTTMTYDDRNNLIALNNAEGEITAYEYDSNNTLISVTDALNNQTEMTYDENGLLLSISMPRDGRINYTYENGLPKTVTDAAGNTTTYEYDDAGRIISIINAADKTTRLDNDVYDNITTIIDPLNNHVHYEYDSRGCLVSYTDARNNTYTYKYDANLNLIKEADPLNNTTLYRYNGEDRVVSKTDPRGKATTYEYDKTGRLIQVIDALGNTQIYDYDLVDNVVSQTNTLNNTTTSTYDALHNLRTVTDPLNNITSFDYDSLNRLIHSTDPLNRATQYHYDALNRMIRTEDPAQGQAKQEFDSDGNRIALVDPNDNRLEFVFNQAGQLTTVNSDSCTISYTYNSLGLIATVTNGRDQTSTFQYDDAGRLIGRVDAEGTITYTYDANGNLLIATDSQGTITRTYDELNRVTSYTDINGNAIGYEYDGAGNLIRLAYPDGKQVSYQYDELNRLVSVTDWNLRTTTYEYDKNSRLIYTSRPDGSQETRSYDENNRLTQIKDILPDGTVLTQYDFTYDAVGNITLEESLPVKQPYTLDDTIMTYGTDNKLQTYNGNPVEYDRDGNMVSGPLNGTMASFSYDSLNRLTAAGTLSYQYDAENNRISVHEAGIGTTTYIVNPNSVLSQVLVGTDTQGNKTYYVYGLGLIGQENPDGSYQSYHYDLRGSTVALADETGQVTDTFEYCPYGELSARTGTTQTPFLFNGEYGVMTDSNGLYHMRARYYNPEIKRFINMDILLGDISKTQSINRYAYVSGQPILFIDPFGRSQLQAFQKGVANITSIPTTFKEGIQGGWKVFREETIPLLQSEEFENACKNTAKTVVACHVVGAASGASKVGIVSDVSATGGVINYVYQNSPKLTEGTLSLYEAVNFAQTAEYSNKRQCRK